MDQRVVNLINNLKRRNISGLYAQTKNKAQGIIETIIPEDSSIGISGSKTLDELGIVARLEGCGNKLFNQYKPGLNQKQSLAIRNS